MASVVWLGWVACPRSARARDTRTLAQMLRGVHCQLIYHLFAEAGGIVGLADVPGAAGIHPQYLEQAANMLADCSESPFSIAFCFVRCATSRMCPGRIDFSSWLCCLLASWRSSPRCRPFFTVKDL